MSETRGGILHSLTRDDRLVMKEDSSSPRFSVRHQVFLALLVAMGIILHVVESSLPTLLLIPGAKLGLANIVTIVVLIHFGFQEAFRVLLLRLLVGSLLSGTFMSITFFLSLSGGLMGFWFLNLSYQYLKGYLSLMGMSILGAFGHNLGQILLAFFIIKNPGLFYYFPYLTLAAIPTGFFTGCLALSLSKYLSLGKLERKGY